MGTKGSLLERLKQFRINWLRRKKKVKVTKHPKLKQFLYNTIALIYFPIGTILDSPKVPKTVLKSKVYKECLSLEQEVIQISKNKATMKSNTFDKKVQKIEQQMILLQKKVSKEQENKQPILKQKISTIQKELQTISKPSQVITVLPKENKIKDKSVVNTSNTMEPLKKAAFKLTEQKIENIEKITPTIIDNKQKNISDIPFIKEITKSIKELEEKLKQLHIKIISSQNYNELYDFEKEVKDYEQKLEQYKQMCKEHQYSIIIDITVDPLEIHKGSKKIDELIEQIKLEKKAISNKKDELYFSKKEVKEEKKAENKKEKIQEKIQEKTEEKKEETSEQYKTAQQMILENIRKQQQVLEDFDKKMKKTKNKRRTLFSYLNNISNQIMKLLFSFTPFFLIKNKLVSTLVTSIFVNNSLKTMKKMMHPEEAIFYEMMEETYHEKQNAYQAVYRLSSNSLDTIQMMKLELLALEEVPSIEVEQLLKQLDSMEEMILQEKLKIEQSQNTTKKEYQKILKKDA